MKHLLEDNFTALDLEEKLGINESAVRRHLKILEDKGLVDHHFEKASRGRPKKLFTLTQRGKEAFPQKTHLVFALLADLIEKKYGSEQLQDLLSEVAGKFAKELEPKEEGIGREERFEKIVNSLEEFGFYLSVEMKNEAYMIKYRNCIFENIKEDLGDKLCKLHDEITRNLFPEKKIELDSKVEKDGKVCFHRISK